MGIHPPFVSKPGDSVKVLTNCCLTILLTGVRKQGGSKFSCRGERCLSQGPYSLSTPSYRPIESSTQDTPHPPTPHRPHSSLISYSSSFYFNTSTPPAFPYSSFLHVQNILNNYLFSSRNASALIPPLPSLPSIHLSVCHLAE